MIPEPCQLGLPLAHTWPIRVRVGLPYSAAGALCRAASALGAPTLISAGSLLRRDSKDGSQWRFTKIGRAAWVTPAALDSAGYVAMLQGGYRFDVSEYVEMVTTNAGDGAMPFPWQWWSSMDYCCEPQIASDRAEVLRRVRLTVETLGDILDELDWWRGEGVNDVPDPMPILQGRLPDDYVRCAKETKRVLRRRRRDGLPGLVGVGSVCRRQLYGSEGLIPVLDALHAALPAHVQLHLFGVKGEALPILQGRYGRRIRSIDSMAWDFAARMTAWREHTPSDVETRTVAMRDWYERQQQRMGRKPATGRK